MLLSSSTGTLGPLGYALNRVLEITLGSVVGMGINRNENGYLLMKSSNENESIHSKNKLSFKRW